MSFAVGNLALFTILHASKYYEHLVNIIKVVSTSFKACLNGCNIVQHCWTNNVGRLLVNVFKRMQQLANNF